MKPIDVLKNQRRDDKCPYCETMRVTADGIPCNANCAHPTMSFVIRASVIDGEPCLRGDWAVCPLNPNQGFPAKPPPGEAKSSIKEGRDGNVT